MDGEANKARGEAREMDTVMQNTKSPIYRIWKHMKSRCLSERDPDYKYYGGRGIGVCQRWMDFRQFAADMGPTHSPGMTIERVNNDADYSPENCRWATRAEQNGNRRGLVRLTHNGETMTMADWARRLGIPYAALKQRRHYGWPTEAMLSPRRHRNGKPKVIPRTRLV